MAKVSRRNWLAMGLVLLTLVCQAHLLPKQAVVLYLQGQVENLAGPVSAGQRLSPGDSLRVGPQSGLTLLLPDGHQVQVAPESEILLQSLTSNVFGQLGTLEVKLLRGHLYLSGRTPSGDLLRLTTPYSTAGIRGTSLALTVEDNSSATSLHSGSIVVSDPLSLPQVLKPGKGTVAAPGHKADTSDLPSAPLLESTSDPVLRQAGTTFHWSPVAEASRYRVEVAQDASFTRVLLSTTTSGDFLRLPPLAEDSPLWLRVFTLNSKGLESLPSPDERREYRVHFVKAGQLRRSRDFLGAIDEVKRAMTYYGQDPLVQDEYGWCQYLAGQHKPAEQTLSHALSLDPRDNQIRLHLARVQYWLGELDKAGENYQQVLVTETQSADAHWGLAETLARQNRFEEAARQARQALSCQSDHAYAEVTLAEALMRLNQESEARRHLLHFLGRPATDRSSTALLISLARHRAFVENAGPAYRSGWRGWFQGHPDEKGRPAP